MKNRISSMGVASCVWTLIVTGNVELSILMNVINSISACGESKCRFYFQCTPVFISLLKMQEQLRFGCLHLVQRWLIENTLKFRIIWWLNTSVFLSFHFSLAYWFNTFFHIHRKYRSQSWWESHSHFWFSSFSHRSWDVFICFRCHFRTYGRYKQNFTLNLPKIK